MKKPGDEWRMKEERQAAVRLNSGTVIVNCMDVQKLHSFTKQYTPCYCSCLSTGLGREFCCDNAKRTMSRKEEMSRCDGARCAKFGDVP